MKLNIYLKAIFFTTIMRTKEGKEEKVEKGTHKKRKIKREKLRMGGKDMTLFSAWPYRQFILVCFLVHRFDVITSAVHSLQRLESYICDPART